MNPTRGIPSGEDADPEGTGAHEVLVVDPDPNVRKGLERVLGDTGLVVSKVPDLTRAQDQLSNRFIPVVVCDLDAAPAAALDFIRFARDKSPMTTVIALTARASFDAVAPAFRAGANDVVTKTADQVAYLRERVVRATAEVSAAVSREQLLADVAEVHEGFLHKMMELARQVTDLEDKLLLRDGASTTTSALGPLNLLIVDDDPTLAGELAREFPVERGWRLRYAQSGGEALDGASQSAPHVVLMKDALPDLPSSMVIKTIKANNPDCVMLLFTPPGPGPGDTSGELRMVEASRLVTLVPTYTRSDQVIAALHDVREALRRKAQERRYLLTFRKQHFEFLQKYSLVRQRLPPRRGPR